MAGDFTFSVDGLRYFFPANSCNWTDTHRIFDSSSFVIWEFDSDRVALVIDSENTVRYGYTGSTSDASFGYSRDSFCRGCHKNEMVKK